MRFAQCPGRGLRRYDQHSATANKLSATFVGLDEGVSPSSALSALKRASAYMGIPLRVIATVDLLFAWTKPQDWRAGALPVVWPSNEMLGQKLGVGVRQVQKLLNQAQALGLISFLDSPNGHRGGRRREDGSIAWGYGILLAPIGTRHAEFVGRSERGAADDARIIVLRKRLAAARRKIRSIAQAAIDAEIGSLGSDADLALALMAIDQMRGVRDTSLLASCAQQIEERAEALEARFASALALNSDPSDSQNSSCVPVFQGVHSTTTNELQSAKADTSRSLAITSGWTSVSPDEAHRGLVDDNLEKYGVTPELIAAVAPDLCAAKTDAPQKWSELTATAERLAGQSGISRHALRDAVRVMGERGATASVFAAIQKYRMGDVRRPGAYLRGMTAKACIGELDLGRTYHALKDATRTAAVKGLADGSEAMALGNLVAQLVRQSRA